MNQKEFIAISDLMTGLMLIFLFIAVVYMLHIETSKKDLENQQAVIIDIARTLQVVEQQIYQALITTFKAEIESNTLVILQDNSIRFYAPEVLFQAGESTLTDYYKDLLQDFFPRYIEILYQYKQDIQEIRIEGHTSSEWNNEVNTKESYKKNLELSQKRAYATLTYCYDLKKTQAYHNWLQGVLLASGLSFGHNIIENGVENKVLSRRVEFRVITKAKLRLDKILQQINIKLGE